MARLIRQSIPAFAAALIVAMSLTVSAPAGAQTTLRAAAVVNDEVISMLDLAMRTRLVILSIGLEDTPETRQRLAPQVLRSLIDERLQIQEAERLGLEVSEEQVDEAFARIAQQNNMAPYEFRRMLESNGVLVESMRDQIRAQLSWEQVVGRRIRPQVNISEEQVDTVVGRLRESDGVVQWRLGEIFLGVDDSSREAEVRSTAQRLVTELRQGANFNAMAQQISQSASASTGGDLGWIQKGQLTDELEEALADMEPGQISPPVRSLDGYHILAMRDRRVVEVGQDTVRLHRIYMPSEQEDATPQEISANLREATQDAQSCAAFDKTGADMESATAGSLGDVPVVGLPPRVRSAVSSLDVAEPSKPVEVEGGFAVFMVCARDDSGIDRRLI
ncbi:MAG: peptidylprolyl isomerase, partial [Rhodovibrionaceae bacterium]|nr:peptidylprolyl isomerase [Rhodovibrionaceae bacterium]